MARFGPRADGPPIFGPGQAWPIYKRRTGPKWADGPSRAPEKPARPGPRPDPSLKRRTYYVKSGHFDCFCRKRNGIKSRTLYERAFKLRRTDELFAFFVLRSTFSNR